MRNLILTITIWLTGVVSLCASVSDSVIVVTDSVKSEKTNFIQKIIKYFEDSNKESDKAFDFSIIGGPHYSSDRKFGLGLVASGLYRTDRSDKDLPVSNVSLYGDITTTGAYVVGVSGNTIFPKMKYRLDAEMFFSNVPSRYWGIGFNHGKRNDNYTEYDVQKIELKLDFLKRINENIYLGITTGVKNIKGRKFEDISYLGDLRKGNTAVGIGAIVSYDSRDFIPNPYKGIYAKIEYMYNPEFLGTTTQFHKTDLVFRFYKSLWKGGILAYNLEGMFNNGDVPWNMLAEMGSSSQMRGYYPGQYRDNHMIHTQLELRQHVYKRNGVVAWVGAGNVFPEFSAWNWRHTLPTYGFGYRWEFKNRVNVRLDYGIGKGQSAFYFSINEAF